MTARKTPTAPEPANLFETESEIASAHDEPQPIDVAIAVVAIAVGKPIRLREQAQSLVVPNGLEVTSTRGCRFTDSHA